MRQPDLNNPITRLPHRELPTTKIRRATRNTDPDGRNHCATGIKTPLSTASSRWRPEPWRRGGRRPYCPQRPAQQTSQPAPPVQSELSRQWWGTHHLGPAPIAFATHVWMKRSLAGSASILWAASAQAICAWTSHCFTKLKRAAPASLCSVAFSLQVWSAAAVSLMTKPQSTKIRARGRIRSSRYRKRANPYVRRCSEGAPCPSHDRRFTWLEQSFAI